MKREKQGKSVTDKEKPLDHITTRCFSFHSNSPLDDQNNQTHKQRERTGRKKDNERESSILDANKHHRDASARDWHR